MTKFVKLEEVDSKTITPQLLFIGMTSLLERMDRLEEVVADLSSVMGIQLTHSEPSNYREIVEALVVHLSEFVEKLQKEREVQHEAQVQFEFLNSPE